MPTSKPFQATTGHCACPRCNAARSGSGCDGEARSIQLKGSVFGCLRRWMGRVLFLGLLGIIAAMPVLSQGWVSITALTPGPSAGLVTLEFLNVRSIPDSGLASGFRLEISTNLATGKWTSSALVPEPHPFQPNAFTAAVAAGEGSDAVFYRILPLADVSLDVDGDGLTTGLEGLLGTLPNLKDTDGDGFNDGVEYAYGTDPRDPRVKPTELAVPTVSFGSLRSVAVEGGAVVEVSVVVDRAFHGVVKYAVNPSGNAKVGVDFMLGNDPKATSGSVVLNGTAATIPIRLLDDALASGQRAIVLNLQLNGATYRLGVHPMHAVLLSDNDAWWTGALFPASGELSSKIFRLQISHVGNATTAKFGAGAGLDGLAIPVVKPRQGAPDIQSTSISSGLFPAGTWQGTEVVDTSTRFHVVSPVVDVPVIRGSLFAATPRRRKLELNAQPSLATTLKPHSLTNLMYQGEYTETLLRRDGNVDTQVRGVFILTRDVPAPLPILNSLLP